MTLRNGGDLEKYVPAVRGTADNPMTKQEVESKCLDLLSGVMGDSKARQLIKLIWDMDAKTPILSLRPLLVV